MVVSYWAHTSQTAASDEGEHYPALTDAMKLTRLDFNLLCCFATS